MHEEFGDPPCSVTGDHYWKGGCCSQCGERLRCLYCHRFATIEALEDHVAGHVAEEQRSEAFDAQR